MFKKINRASSCSDQYAYKVEPVEEKAPRVMRRFLNHVRKTTGDSLAVAAAQKDGIKKTALKNAEAKLMKAKHSHFMHPAAGMTQRSHSHAH